MNLDHKYRCVEMFSLIYCCLLDFKLLYNISLWSRSHTGSIMFSNVKIHFKENIQPDLNILLDVNEKMKWHQSIWQLYCYSL